MDKNRLPPGGILVPPHALLLEPYLEFQPLKLAESKELVVVLSFMKVVKQRTTTTSYETGFKF